jgi:hypothetical protein
MTLQLGGGGAITGCTSLQEPALTLSGLTVSGPFDVEKIIVSSGTAAAPTYTFSGDTDNGLYYAGTNSIGLATNGTNAILIDSAGKVGIGTSSPAKKLTVNHGAGDGLMLIAPNTSESTIYFGDTDDDDVGRIVYDHSINAMKFRTNTSEAMRIDSSGNVGIGTTSPSVRLDVQGAANSEYMRVGGSSRPLRFSCSAQGAADNANHDIDVDSSAGSLSFSIGTLEKMRIDSSGNVGIGTTSPEYIFDARGSINISGSIFRRGADNTNFSIINRAAQSLVFGTDDTERMRIDSSGRVGIGTTSPSSFDSSADNLVVGAASGNTGITIYGGTTNETSIYFADGTSGNQRYAGTIIYNHNADTMSFGTNGVTGRISISSGGQISGYSATGWDGFSSAMQDAAGTTRKAFLGRYGATATNTGTVSFAVYTNGDVQNTNNSYGAISDIKLKENIVDASSQWYDIKALRPVNYNFKEGQTHTQLGLIAQEVELVSPGLVSESPDHDEDGNDLGTVTKSVNYSVLYMKAVKALQEGMERIEQLETEMAEVKAQLQAS